MKHPVKHLLKQAGVTLMELIAGLAVMALIVGGALALFGSATSSQSSVQMTQDLVAVRSATQQIWNGQGTYGTTGTVLNDILVSANRIPSSIQVDASTTPDTLTHRVNNGTMTIESTGGGFEITITNITPDVCIPLMTNANGWVSVSAGTGTTITAFPVNPATARTDCASGSTMVFGSR